MPVGEEEKVFVMSIHRKLGRMMSHYLTIKRYEKISAAKRASRMSALATMNHANNIAAHLTRHILQVMYIHKVCEILGAKIV
jgi:hypothetical protein